MRFIIIITFLLSFLVGNTAFAQKKTLLSRPYQSLIKSGPVHAYLEELNARSGIVIEYASNSVHADRLVTLNGSETSVGSLLKTVLTGQRVRLLEKNKKLILVKSSSVINTDELVPTYILFGFVKAQNSKEPMIGATVIEHSSNKAIATNSYGYFSLSLPEGSHRIEISYVGYNSGIMEVGS